MKRILPWSSLLVALALSACASQRETMSTTYRGAEVVASGPIAADDAAMKQKPGTVKTKRTSSTSSKSNGTDTETQSSETTTVVGASAVAAPDSEVKFKQ